MSVAPGRIVHWHDNVFPLPVGDKATRHVTSGADIRFQRQIHDGHLQRTNKLISAIEESPSPRPHIHWLLRPSEKSSAVESKSAEVQRQLIAKMLQQHCLSYEFL